MNDKQYAHDLLDRLWPGQLAAVVHLLETIVPPDVGKDGPRTRNGEWLSGSLGLSRPKPISVPSRAVPSNYAASNRHSFASAHKITESSSVKEASIWRSSECSTAKRRTVGLGHYKRLNRFSRMPSSGIRLSNPPLVF